jgi:transposase
MLSVEQAQRAQQMRQRGSPIAAIARHLGHDRKTIRDYLTGRRTPGVRKGHTDPFEPFIDYCKQRFADDPHLWSSTLFTELVELGYAGAYSSLNRALRRHNLRPDCQICRQARK